MSKETRMKIVKNGPLVVDNLTKIVKSTGSHEE